MTERNRRIAPGGVGILVGALGLVLSRVIVEILRISNAAVSDSGLAAALAISTVAATVGTLAVVWWLFWLMGWAPRKRALSLDDHGEWLFAFGQDPEVASAITQLGGVAARPWQLLDGYPTATLGDNGLTIWGGVSTPRVKLRVPVGSIERVSSGRVARSWLMVDAVVFTVKAGGTEVDLPLPLVAVDRPWVPRALSRGEVQRAAEQAASVLVGARTDGR